MRSAVSMAVPVTEACSTRNDRLSSGRGSLVAISGGEGEAVHRAVDVQGRVEVVATAVGVLCLGLVDVSGGANDGSERGDEQVGAPPRGRLTRCRALSRDLPRQLVRMGHTRYVLCVRLPPAPPFRQLCPRPLQILISSPSSSNMTKPSPLLSLSTELNHIFCPAGD